MKFFNKQEIILFQGDSITDCGRNREEADSLGAGYPLLIASRLPAVCIDHDFTFINKGISGNRVIDLDARWTEDCVNLKPTIVSILIGINDTWRKFDSNDPTDEESFEKHYRNILKRTADEVCAKIILMEPFALPARDNYDNWRLDLDPKIHVIRKLSREFGALYIPLDGIFASACAKKAPNFWAADGVHPTKAGHGIIAEAWFKSVCRK